MKQSKQTKKLTLKEPQFNYINSGRVTVCIMKDVDGHRYRGVAKCDPNDVFDVEFGKKMSNARARLKKEKLHLKRLTKQENIVAKNMLNLRAELFALEDA